MRVIRDFPVGVTIQDPIKVAENKEAYLMEYLKQSYENRCFNGYLITEITELVACSNMMQLINNLQGYCNVNVIFRANCTVFVANETIPRCKIGNINEQNTINCTTDEGNASIIIKWEKPYEFLKVGQYIPVQAVRVLYNPNNPRVGIHAKLYIPQITNEYYRISDAKIPEKSKERKLDTLFSLPGLIDKIEETLLYFKGLKQDKDLGAIYDKFVEVASQKAGLSTDPKSYKGAVNFLEAAKTKKLEELEATAKAGSVIVYSADINHILPLVAVEKPAANITEPVIELDSNSLLLLLLSKYLLHIMTVRMFIETYSTKELIATHDNIWRFYAFLKKKAAASA